MHIQTPGAAAGQGPPSLAALWTSGEDAGVIPPHCCAWSLALLRLEFPDKYHPRAQQAAQTENSSPEPEADTASKSVEQLTCSNKKGIWKSMEAAVYMTFDDWSRIRTARHLRTSTQINKILIWLFNPDEWRAVLGSDHSSKVMYTAASILFLMPFLSEQVSCSTDFAAVSASGLGLLFFENLQHCYNVLQVPFRCFAEGDHVIQVKSTNGKCECLGTLCQAADGECHLAGRS